MDSIGLLERAQALGLRVWVDGAQLRVRGRKDHTAVVQELLAHKAEVIALLTPPPTGETAAAAATAPACEHAATYRRPSGVLVCTGCGAAQVPGNPTWHRQHPRYCDDDQHVPYLDTPPDHPRQCQRCPYVWPPQVTPAAPVSTTPAHQAALALPLGASTPHGEVPPQRKVRR